MRRSTTAMTRLASLVLVAALAGCAQDPAEPMLAPDAAAEFALPDVNPRSASFGQQVSVRRYQGWVSAWYFSHAT